MISTVGRVNDEHALAIAIPGHTRYRIGGGGIVAINDEHKQQTLKSLAGLYALRQRKQADIDLLDKDIAAVMTMALRHKVGWADIGRVLNMNRGTVYRWHHRRR